MEALKLFSMMRVLTQRHNYTQREKISLYIFEDAGVAVAVAGEKEEEEKGGGGGDSTHSGVN